MHEAIAAALICAALTLAPVIAMIARLPMNKARRRQQPSRAR